MHRLPNRSAVTRFRLAAVLLVLAWLLVPLGAGTLVYALMIHDQDVAMIAAIVGGTGLFLGISQLVVAAKARCPLCMTPSLINKGCSKHRNSRRLFGSYRLRAAVSVLARGHFRCPYCNEPTVMEPRNPRR
jgi:hypothetical protein